MAYDADLVGRDVELVLAAVFEEQIVAFDAAECPGDHAAETSDAVLVVHDVVARREVVEGVLRGVSASSGTSMSSTAAGDVGLGQYGQLRVGEDRPAFERRDHNPGRFAELVEHREIDAVVGEQDR